MEQGINIFTPLSEAVPSARNKGDFLKPSESNETSTVKFSELVLDASKTAVLWPAEGTGGIETPQTNAFGVLKGQTEELLQETANLLEDAFQEGAEPEVIDGILSEAVSQLRALFEDFDAQHGTQYTSDLSQAVVQLSSNLEGEELIVQPLIFPAPVAVSSEEFKPVILKGDAQNITYVPEDRRIDVPILKQVSNFLTSLQSILGQTPAQNPQKHTFYPVAEVNNLGQIPAQSLAEDVIFNMTKPPSAQQVNATVSSFNLNFDIKVKEALLGAAQIASSGKDAPLLRISEPDAVLAPVKPEFQVNTSPSVPIGKGRATTNFSQNIINQIQTQTLNEGVTRIELSPRGLGNILIDLQKQENGSLHVILRAENPIILNALRTDRDALLNVLSEGGISQNDVSLDFDGFDQGAFQDETDDRATGLSTALMEPEDDQADTVNLFTQDRTQMDKLNIIM